MDRNGLQHQVACIRRSLFDQGYLDEQFIQLEELQDDANPDFVQEIVTLFFTDSARLIQNIEHALNSWPINFSKLDDYMHQFKGSSSSIGARKVTKECTMLREYCSAGNAEGSVHFFSTFLVCVYIRITNQARACKLGEEARNLLPDGETGCSCSHSMRLHCKKDARNGDELAFTRTGSLLRKQDFIVYAVNGALAVMPIYQQ
ncbi:hypothetical protein V6N12_052803 [Hibiscus sabdariffa]|uniref:Histidine-containing phosphotransfer protein n=1 Tax=Hibiscus sabdariffa TaxID=183260 RepID=A0ABR2C2T7_9ROSI